VKLQVLKKLISYGLLGKSRKLLKNFQAMRNTLKITGLMGHLREFLHRIKFTLRKFMEEWKTIFILQIRKVF